MAIEEINADGDDMGTSIFPLSYIYTRLGQYGQSTRHQVNNVEVIPTSSQFTYFRTQAETHRGVAIWIN